jgi:hypothetical protein
MTKTCIQIDEDDFHEKYSFIPNHLRPNACWTYGDGPGCLFETYGEEHAFVRSQDPRTIWTLLECDDTKELVQSGYHLVNRLGYLISTVPFPDDVHIEVRIPLATDLEEVWGDDPDYEYPDGYNAEDE